MRSHVIRCPHCGANLAARETHGPAFPPRERWRNLERAVRERMHPGYREVFLRLRAIPVGQGFTVHDLGFRGGKGHVTVSAVLRAAEEHRVVGWTGRRAFAPNRAPIGKPRYLIYERLC